MTRYEFRPRKTGMTEQIEREMAALRRYRSVVLIRREDLAEPRTVTPGKTWVDEYYLRETLCQGEPFIIPRNPVDWPPSPDQEPR